MTDAIDWELAQEQDRKVLKREHQEYEQSNNVFRKAKKTILAFLGDREKYRRERAESLPLSAFGMICENEEAKRRSLVAIQDGDDPPEPDFGATFDEIVFEVRRNHIGTPESVVKGALTSLFEEGKIYRENGMIGTDKVRVFRLDRTPPSEQKTKALRERRDHPRSILRLEASSREGFIDVEPLSDSESRTLLDELQVARAARPKEPAPSVSPVKKKKRYTRGIIEQRAYELVKGEKMTLEQAGAKLAREIKREAPFSTTAVWKAINRHVDLLAEMGLSENSRSAALKATYEIRDDDA